MVRGRRAVLEPTTGRYDGFLDFMAHGTGEAARPPVNGTAKIAKSNPRSTGARMASAQDVLRGRRTTLYCLQIIQGQLV